MPEMDEPLEATHRKCLDCGDISEDLSWGECESCGSENRAFEFVLRSPEPRGFEDDDDYYIAAGPWGPEVWEYPAEEPL